MDVINASSLTDTHNATSSNNTIGLLNDTDTLQDEIIYPEEIVSEWLWKVLSPIIFTFGLTGNLLTLCVVRRMGVRNQPTLVFISFLAITDSTVLCTGLPSYWMSYTFDFSLRNASNANCRLYLFFIYTSMQYSSWILVGVAVERFIKTYFPFRYRRIFTNKKAIISLIVTLIVLCLIDGHLLFTNGINEFTEGDCGSLTDKQLWFDEKVFVYIDFAVLSALPFAIMLTCNIFIAKMLRKLGLRRRSMVRRESQGRANRVSIKMTKMFLVCTSFFLVTTAPISIYFILDSYLTPQYIEANDNKSIARMDLAWTISYLLQFSNYSINFYLYTAVNNRFLQELRALIQCKPSLRTMRIYTVRNHNKGSSRRTLNSSAEPTSIGLEQSVSDETIREQNETVDEQNVSIDEHNSTLQDEAIREQNDTLTRETIEEQHSTSHHVTIGYQNDTPKHVEMGQQNNTKHDSIREQNDILTRETRGQNKTLTQEVIGHQNDKPKQEEIGQQNNTKHDSIGEQNDTLTHETIGQNKTLSHEVRGHQNDAPKHVEMGQQNNTKHDSIGEQNDTLQQQLNPGNDDINNTYA